MIDAERPTSREVPTEPELIAAEMLRVRAQIDDHELYFSQLAAAFAKTEYWDDAGAATAIDWIRINCKMTSNAAAVRVAVGKNLDRMAESAQAMHAGEIGFAHMTVMARTANTLGDAFDEKQLLEKARDCSPGKFYYRCQHYRHSVQPTVYADEQAEQVENRRLFLSTAEDGSLILTGVLDPVGGAALRSALEPVARPSGAHDYREREQRLADALLELVTHGGKQKVQMQVTSSVETLLGLIGAPGADMEFSLPVSSKTVERWACDCSVSRVLMQGSVVIDVGRAKRVISGPTRRALNARDQHCVWPGCERPASWSDGHHLVAWMHGGTSDLPNLALLCLRHHWMVHEGDWQLVKTDTGKIMPVAPMIRFGSPRGPDVSHSSQGLATLGNYSR